MRIGIGKPPSKERGADHVLSRLPQGRARAARRRRAAGRRRRRADRRRRRRRGDARDEWSVTRASRRARPGRGAHRRTADLRRRTSFASCRGAVRRSEPSTVTSPASSPAGAPLLRSLLGTDVADPGRPDPGAGAARRVRRLARPRPHVAWSARGDVRPAIAALGIDIEPRRPARRRRRLHRPAPPTRSASTRHLAFCLKEAAYKALEHARRPHSLDHHDGAV